MSDRPHWVVAENDFGLADNRTGEYPESGGEWRVGPHAHNIKAITHAINAVAADDRVEDPVRLFTRWAIKNDLLTLEEREHYWWVEVVYLAVTRDETLALRWKTLVRMGVIENA